MKYITPSKKTHLILLVFLFEFFLIFPLSYGSTEKNGAKKPSNAFWSVGNTTMFPGKVQIDKEGTTETFNFNPTFSFGLEYPYKESLLIIPELGLNFSGNGRHAAISRFTFFISTDLGKRFKYFLLHTGIGLHWTFIDGPGGTETLNNGNSSTAFYLPEFTSISSNLTWTNGIGFPLDFMFDQKNASLKLDAALYNPFNSLKRAVTYRIALQFSFSIEGLPTFFNGG